MWIWILFGCVIVQPCICYGELIQNQSLQFSPRDGHGWGWGGDSDKKSTFFDVALTSLAFLSFGVFLLNLLLNALLYPTAATGVTQPTGPILTMITGSTGGAIVTGRSLGKRFQRVRRHPFTPEVDHVTAARNLVKFVTTSIEMMTERHECLPKVMCEGSRQASLMGSRYQLIFSLIGVSISYLSRFLGISNDLPTHLNAMLLGARNENCESAFPNCKRR